MQKSSAVSSPSLLATSADFTSLKQAAAPIEVTFDSNPAYVRKYADDLRYALNSRGDQAAMTRVASMVMACIQHLATHYGVEQGEEALRQACEAGFTKCHNADIERQSQAQRTPAGTGAGQAKREGELGGPPKIKTPVSEPPNRPAPHSGNSDGAPR